MVLTKTWIPKSVTYILLNVASLPKNTRLYTKPKGQHYLKISSKITLKLVCDKKGNKSSNRNPIIGTLPTSLICLYVFHLQILGSASSSHCDPVLAFGICQNTVRRSSSSASGIGTDAAWDRACNRCTRLSSLWHSMTAISIYTPPNCVRCILKGLP